MASLVKEISSKVMKFKCLTQDNFPSFLIGLSTIHTISLKFCILWVLLKIQYILNYNQNMGDRKSEFSSPILFFTSLVVITIAIAAFGSKHLSTDCRMNRVLHLREILWDALYSAFTDHILLLVERRQQNPCDSKIMLEFFSRTKSMSFQTKPPWNTSTYNYGELVGVRPFTAAGGRELENPSRIFVKRNKRKWKTTCSQGNKDLRGQ